MLSRDDWKTAGPVVIVELGCALSRDDWKTAGPVVIV